MAEDLRYAVIATGRPQGLHSAAQELIAAGFDAQILPPQDGQTNT